MCPFYLKRRLTHGVWASRGVSWKRNLSYAAFVRLISSTALLVVRTVCCPPYHGAWSIAVPPCCKAVQPSAVCRQPEIRLPLCDAEGVNYRHPNGRDAVATESGKPSILTFLGNVLPARFSWITFICTWDLERNLYNWDMSGWKEIYGIIKCDREHH